MVAMSKGAERNQPCWCGSGRKRKKCHPGAVRRRERRLTYNFGKPVAPAKVGVNPRTGEVEFLDAEGKLMRPVRVVSETAYEGETQSKIVSRLHLDPSGPLNATPEANLVNFDRIYVADTSPLDNGDETLAVTAFGLAIAQRVSSEMSAVRFEMAGLLEFHGLRSINPELAAWATVIELVRTAPDYNPSWLVGLVGDSELDQLVQFNERLAAVAGSVLLPHNFRMHYAGDRASDGALNRAIRACDGLSRDAVEKFVSTPPPSLHQRIPTPGVPCSWWRLWVRTGSQESAQFAMAEASARVDAHFRLVRSPLLVDGLSRKR